MGSNKPTSRPQAKIADLNDASFAGAPALSSKASQILAKIGPGPLRPGPLLELLEIKDNDPKRVAAAVSREPNLTARILGVANSAWFARQNPIKTIQQAVLHLGGTRAKTIAIAQASQLLTHSCKLPTQQLKQLWISSLTKACAAQLISQHISAGDGHAAFAAGLLQDLGLPILMEFDPDFYNKLLDSNFETASWSRQEREHFGLDHARVSAYLLEKWDVPPSIARNIQEHHIPPTKNNTNTGLERLPAFMAGLLPHLQESPSNKQRAWITTIHAKFLADAYPSPDHLWQTAQQEALPLYNHETDRKAVDTPPTPQACLDVLATQTIEVVNKLHRLEQSLGKQKENMGTLRMEAFTDPLSRLLNRRGFLRLSQMRLQNTAFGGICCVLLDMDNFKPINDQYGHEIGDRTLRGLAKLLRRSLDRNDLIARLGGDEFAMLLTGLTEPQARDTIQRVCSRCLHARLIVDQGVEVTVSFSLGAVYCNQITPNLSIESMLEAADTAMYECKHNGKHGSVFMTYEPSPTADPTNILTSEIPPADLPPSIDNPDNDIPGILNDTP